MADIFCPKCGKVNPSELETCQYCGTSLKPLASTYLDAPLPIKPGESPVVKNTSEFEKVRLATSDLVHPGEAPTVKSTSALESTLPSWLRSLRKGDDSAENESGAGTPPGESLPLGPAQEPNPESTDDQPDWLTGLGKIVSDDEKEVPDWLASLREEKPDNTPLESTSLQEPALNTTGSLSMGETEADWAARMGGEPTPEALETKPESEVSEGGESFDWLDSLKPESDVPSSGVQLPEPQDEALNEWLSGLPGSSEEIQQSTVENEGLPENTDQPLETPLNLESAPVEEDMKVAGIDAPDWLSNLGSIPPVSEEPSRESLPEWLSDMEIKAGPESVPPATPSNSDIPAPGDAGNEFPDWLAQFPASEPGIDGQPATKKPSDTVPLSSGIETGTGPLPEWLAGIKRTTPPSDATPALIAGKEVPGSGEKSTPPFSMETPDWLSQLKPEQVTEKASPGTNQPITPDSMEISELPSWVQAMRPVESVMEETKSAPQEQAQVTEKTGPLAGLPGVLPSVPGLGTLRKPPAYTAVLQVTEGQQRYASALEQLITSETQPQEVGKSRLASSRWWRWLIAVLLIAAVGLPLYLGIPATPASTLNPPEMVSAFTLIGSLPSNAPVLVVFDYAPSLFGELEAAAAPLMDHLLLQGPRLALISTSPTGPALAERLLHDPNASPLVAAHNYQSEQQYVNLGYLAGGPAGVQYFANSPTSAAPFTLDGTRAWSMAPLQGVQVLSDFAAIIILTDSADTGRVWIEQTSSAIGNTPMLMVISAQAEPMILPYYDSGQIKGLVTGLAGGDAYGQTFIRPDAQTGLAEKYWNSFGVGILVAELLIVAGALWNVVAGLRSRGEKSGKRI
jgi:hypothetical protein